MNEQDLHCLRSYAALLADARFDHDDPKQREWLHLKAKEMEVLVDRLVEEEPGTDRMADAHVFAEVYKFSPGSDADRHEFAHEAVKVFQRTR